jgi:hypothetical protein
MIGKSLDIVGNDREMIDILGYIGIYGLSEMFAGL